MKNNKMSSAKQKLQRELLKKPKVSREFKRVLPASILIIVLVGFMITMSFASFYVDEAAAQMGEGQEWFEERLNRNGDRLKESDFNSGEELPQGAFAQLSWYTDMPSVMLDGSDLAAFFEVYQAFRTAMGEQICMDYSYKACYDYQGELITDQSPDIYLFVPHYEDENGEKKPTDIYMLDKEAFDQVYPGGFKDLVNKADVRLNMYRNLELRFTDIYVKGDTVMPKKLALMEVEGLYEPELSEGTVVAEYDFSGLDFSDYEYLAKAKGEGVRFLGPILTGNVWDNNPHKAYLDSFPEEKLQQGIERAVADGVDYKVVHDSPFHYAGVCFFRSSCAGVVTVTAVDYDFWAVWWPLMLTIYVILLVIGLIVALIWAFIRYNRKKISYEVYNQRREMTNAMAHDLKSPLMAISGYAENIGDGSDSAKAAGNALKIRESVKQMDQMIVNILDLAKLEDMSYKVKLVEVDLAALVQERADNLAETMAAKQMKLVVNGVGRIKADKSQMVSLIDNLLINAIKYGTEGSTIQVDVSDKQLCVRNAFDYVLDQDVSTLTKPFVKGNNARGSVGGNGLGLSIVENIAQMHGFRVKVLKDSEQVMKRTGQNPKNVEQESKIGESAVQIFEVEIGF